MTPNEMADVLEKLQAPKNDGHGVSCIRAMVVYLRAGMIRDAEVVANTKHKKIRNHIDIMKFIQSQPELKIMGYDLDGNDVK